MTLPLFMANRPAVSFDDGLQDLESICVSALASKFNPMMDTSMLGDLSNLPEYAACVPIKEAAASLGMRANDTSPYSSSSKKRPFVLTADEAADVVDTALGQCSFISSPSTPKRPLKKKARSTKIKSKKQLTRSSSLPTADDPIDPTFLLRLYSSRDEGRVNPAHVIVRRDILEVRRTMSGRVLFQCGCCAHVPRAKRAKLSTLSPQCVDNLYRAMVRFMMNHVRACEHVPQEIKELSPKASRVVDMSGTKKYWVKSAKKMGLRDGADGKSIVYWWIYLPSGE